MSYVSIKRAVLSLIADINGDESQGHLPVSMAMRITYALLRNNTVELDSIRVECTDAGWACVVEFDANNADKWRNAYAYCVAGAKCLSDETV